MQQEKLNFLLGKLWTGRITGIIKVRQENHHPQLEEELPGIDMEQMISGPEVVENELRDTKREESAAKNDNTTTGIMGVPIIVDEAPALVKDEESGSEG